MPWKETSPVEERLRLVEAWLDDEYDNMAQLCRAFGISRKTGYKWIARFKQGGAEALGDRSRAARTHPNATPDKVVELVVAARRMHPTWGPKKLQVWLRDRGWPIPAASTIGAILKREGLVRRRRRKVRQGNFATDLTAQDRPNAVWSADFKGWFRLGRGDRCYPLTISDGYSRYLLRCQALKHPDEMASRTVFESAFGEFGLPDVIRTDNGTPFSAVYGVSALSVWWVKLGIRPERIQPGRPTQNGRHERMHRTLKAEAIKSGKTMRVHWAQQRVFDNFRWEYNEERPHEALGQKTPSSLYEPSLRPFPNKLRSPEYANDFEVYIVRQGGTIALPGRMLFLSSVLEGEPVGLELQEDGSKKIFYGPLYLGSLSAEGRFSRGTRRRRKVKAPDDETLRISGS